MLERQAGVVIISKPNKKAKHNNGLGSLKERVAIMWVPQNCQASCMPRARTEDTVTVKLGDVLISDARGKILENWTAEIGVFLVNSDLSATCRRPHGESTTDLTRASSGALARVTNSSVDQSAATEKRKLNRHKIDQEKLQLAIEMKKWNNPRDSDDTVD
ncbi:hypothetical protein RUM43_014082 [Polyplax serrata]|uniref:Uncharacterized protein n=1 Tax=Polyplax serrata TaxID=468196 RepID=A0AAN8S2R5_POLSC